LYLSSVAGLNLQKTARLSFRLSGGNFTTKRHSSALHSTQGNSASADVQYRLTRRSTIGAMYSYQRFGFSGYDGGTDAHGAAGSYSIRINKSAEISGYAGFLRVESTFLQATAVDPVIQVLLGVQSTVQLVHTLRYVPN